MKFSKLQLITMGALIIALLFNPMSYQILKDYIEIAFTSISVIATVWCVGFLLYKVLKPERVNVPKKTKKQKVKTSDYIQD